MECGCAPSVMHVTTITMLSIKCEFNGHTCLDLFCTISHREFLGRAAGPGGGGGDSVLYPESWYEFGPPADAPEHE